MAVTYDVPQREIYPFPSAAYGSAAVNKSFIGPKGKKGIVRDIVISAPTADIVGTTSVPEVTVGAAAGTTEYARFRLGTTAILGYTIVGGPRRASALITGPANTGGIPPVLNDFAGHVALETASIPADTAFVMSAKIGVGTPAGTFDFFVVVDWF